MFSEPVFVGSPEQQRRQRQAWEATISRCRTCRKVITGLGHVCDITCADCWAQEQRARRAGQQQTTTTRRRTR